MGWMLRRKSGETIAIEGEVSIGRDPTCTIQLATPAVSRLHTRLQVWPDHIVVTDEGRNGTLVNGIRIAKVAQVGLGDVIEIDTEQFHVQRSAPNLAVPPPQGQPRDPRMAQPSFSPLASPTVFPPGLAPTPASFSAVALSTAESPTAVDEPAPIALEVEVIEDPAAPQLRYRDAVRMDETALLAVTDFAPGAALTPELIYGWKGIVRKAGGKGKAPDAILQLLNHELFDAGLPAMGTCVRVDLRERLVVVACAGSAAPFVIRGGKRVVRVQTPPTVGLGRLRGAQFVLRSLHFDRGDTLLVPSAAWAGPLEALLGTAVTLGDLRAPEWIRRQRIDPPGASLLCLDLR